MAEAAAGGAPTAAPAEGTPAPESPQPVARGPEQRRAESLDEGQEGSTPKLKPIKRLPGLVDQADDPQDEVIARRRAAREKAAKEQTPAAPKSEASDAGSQGVSREAASPSPAPDKADSPASPAEPASEASDAKADKFKFAGKEWESPDKAEHAFRTMQGMHKSLVEREKAETEKAAGWYREAQRLQSELDLLKKGQVAGQPPAAQPQPVVPTKPEDDGLSTLLEAVDPKTFKAIYENEQQGPAIALLWALQKFQGLVDSRLKSSLDTRLSPFEEQKKASAATQRIVQTFNGVGSMTDPASGDYLYPELRDPQFLERTVHAWHSLRMPEELAYSHAGVHAAYLITKDFFQRSGIALASNVKPTSTPPAPSPVDKVAEAVAASLNGKPPVPLTTTTPLHRGNGQPQSEEMLLRRAILQAGSTDPKLGFEITRKQ